MMICREHCLTKNEELFSAIDVLTKELEGDYFINGLETCSSCKLNLDKNTAINIHCQLKSVYDVLSKIKQLLAELKKDT